ncbi:PepSY domain-containing protein [Phaeobacter sp. B1627]|uniref:PepSY domain-containing protein n=1 Tax=Phaeobacter sp. B1627 TaxID=2583809 RepID=UPI0011189E18|nr:PepSY domain-containing protein [Phaeobacter sp. B1627]TNJ47422.1 PepSY domain-containing protein [Phaeobacter sp. B1627]
MRKLFILAAVITAPGLAFADEIDPEVVAKIEAKLAEMECQMDPDDIEMEEGGYELDDVICKGGHQFDIELDADLNETGRRAE